LLADSACRANRRARNRAVCSRIASSLAWYSAIACRPSRPCSFLNSAGLLTIRSGSTQREPSPLRGNKIVPLLLTRAVATTCHFCRRYVVHNGRASKGTSACRNCTGAWVAILLAPAVIACPCAVMLCTVSAGMGTRSFSRLKRARAQASQSDIACRENASPKAAGLRRVTAHPAHWKPYLRATF